MTVLRRSKKSILNASLVLFNASRDNLREEGQGAVLHHAHSPIVIGQDHSVHLGGSFSYRWNASEDDTQFRTRPEIATVNDYYVDTGTIAGADRVRTLLAAGKKPVTRAQLVPESTISPDGQCNKSAGCGPARQ